MKKIITLIIISSLFLSSSLVYAGYYERGRTYYVYKNFDKAKEMFLKAVEKKNHGDSYYFLGEIEKRQENYKEAIEYFSKAVKANTTRKYKKNAYWNLIVISEMNGNFDNLIKTCKYMWEKLNDQSAKAKIEKIINKSLWTNNKNAINKYKLGLKYKKKKNLEKAKELFQESISLDNNFLAPKFELGMFAYNNNNMNNASSYLNEIISKIPFHADIHLILADINFKNKEYNNAIEHFSKALDYGFNRKRTIYFIKLRRGASYYYNKNYESADIDISDALEIKGNAIEPLMLLASINIKLKNYEKALKFLHKAYRIDKKNPNILYKIGSIYYKQDNWKFMSYFDRLFNMTRKSENRQKYFKAFKILIKKHSEKKNNNRVIEIASSLDDKNNDYKIILILAKTYYRQNKFDKAIDYYEQISLEDKDKFTLCKAYYRSGRKEKAKEYLTRLIYNENYYKKAKKNRYLKNLLKTIDIEKKENNKIEKDNTNEGALLLKNRFTQYWPVRIYFGRSRN